MVTAYPTYTRQSARVTGSHRRGVCGDSRQSGGRRASVYDQPGVGATPDLAVAGHTVATAVALRVEVAVAVVIAVVVAVAVAVTVAVAVGARLTFGDTPRSPRGG
jgi:hypothetical protein